MKKLLIILIAFILIGCTVEPSIPKPLPVHEAVPEEVNPFLGTWIKYGTGYSLAWEFYDNGDFLYYKIDPLEIKNDGWYGIDSGSIYLEDYFNGQSATYSYEILEDYPSVGQTTLRWPPGDWLKQ